MITFSPFHSPICSLMITTQHTLSYLSPLSNSQSWTKMRRVMTRHHTYCRGQQARQEQQEDSCCPHLVSLSLTASSCAGREEEASSPASTPSFNAPLFHSVCAFPPLTGPSFRLSSTFATSEPPPMLPDAPIMGNLHLKVLVIKD